MNEPTSSNIDSRRSTLLHQGQQPQQREADVVLLVVAATVWSYISSSMYGVPREHVAAKRPYAEAYRALPAALS